MDKGYNEKLSNEWIDWVENSKGTRENEIFPYIKNWLDNLKPKSLVDIGCGQGSCSSLINSKIKYIGIEPSEILIKRAIAIFSESNKKFIKGDAYNLPLEDSSIDSIISIWVWSHLENLKLAAKEINRVLEKNGKFLLITAHPETYEERKTFYSDYVINENLLTGTFDLDNGKFLTDSTLYLHTEDEIKNSLLEAGLKIDNVSKMGIYYEDNRGLYLVIECSK